MSKFVITDPSYILPSEIWEECCDKAKAHGDDGWGEYFNGIVQEALKEFTQGQAFVSGTGFGDWDNGLWGPNIDDNGNFYADAGMVSVCEYNEKVASRLGNIVQKGGASVFNAQGPIKVKFDTSDSSWTVVEIWDAKGDYWHTDVPYDEDEDEE